MTLNTTGLIVVIVLYILILVVGLLAARYKQTGTGSQLEQSLVANRDLNILVGVLTTSATLVGGGYINGSAESVYTDGLIWTLAPFGICIGLIIGGLFYAKPLRDKQYLTMLDPIYEKAGPVTVLLVYLATLVGDLFWTASILNALGTSLSTILDINLTVAIVTSASVTLTYTMFGQMISVAYTDVVQLFLLTFGLALAVPFVLTNKNIEINRLSTVNWKGNVEKKQIGLWIDLLITMIFGTIPWQSYIQRLLSVRNSRQAQVFSVIGGIVTLALVTPSVLIGAAAKVADWNVTSLHSSPMNLNMSNMVLPLVLKEFSPPAVAIIGLGSISAAVMSSMDSSVLGSSSMFSHNIYRSIFRKQASDKEILWIHRFSVVFIGAMATIISLSVNAIYGLFVFAADIVFVIVLPQLTCSLFFKYTNIFGAISGYLIGLVMRVGGGEYFLDFHGFIKYPMYDKEMGQLFPFRIFSSFCSTITILTISTSTHLLYHKCGRDFLNCNDYASVRVVSFRRTGQDDNFDQENDIPFNVNIRENDDS